MIARPQPATATITQRPGWTARPTQPVRAAPTRAPAAGAAAMSPTPAGPTPKTSSASAGKSEAGIPNTIATMSMTKVDRTIRLPRANRSPSFTVSRLGRAASGRGGMGAITSRATIAAANVTVSKRKAEATPTVASNSPPSTGPATAMAWKPSWLRAMAAGSRSRGTRRGMADDRAGWSTAPRPAATKATT